MTSKGLGGFSKNVKIYSIISLIFFIYIISSFSSYGQYQKDPLFDKLIFKHWSININTGRTSFFGDVSAYDEELTEKLSKESSMGYGFIITRQISPVVSFGGQLLIGKLIGSTSASSFEANIFEYNIHLTLDAANLFIPNNDAHFRPYAKFGMGQFKFDSRLQFNDPEKEDLIVDTGIPEFLFTFGGGLNYMLSNSFDLNAEMSIKMVNNDKLDGKSSSNDEDYYSYLSFGITYKINNVTRTIRDTKKMGKRFPMVKRR
jgi:hypothetical protein